MPTIGCLTQLILRPLRLTRMARVMPSARTALLGTAFAVTCLIGACEPTSAPVHVAASPSTPATHPAVSWQHQAPGKPAAERVAQELVDAAVIPPDSQRLSISPSTGLDHPFLEVAALNLIDRNAWWKVNLSADSLVAYLKSHPPSKMILSGSGGASGPHQPTVHSLRFDGTGSGPGGEPTLLLSVVSAGKQNAWLRADGQTIWYPPRPDAETAPSDATITISLSSGPTRKITDRASVRRLAAEFNELTISPPFVSAGGCWVRPMLSIAFAKAGSTHPSLVATTSPCGSSFGLGVSGPHGSLPALGAGAALITDALRLLGVPSTALEPSPSATHP